MPQVAVVIPYIAAAAAVAGTAASVYSSVEAGNEANAAQDAAAAQAEAERAAAEQASIFEEEDRRNRLNRILATQRATFGAGGINASDGSAGAFRSASVGEAAREQMQSNLIAERENQARNSRINYTRANKGQIATSRNLAIGSSVVDSANRYLQTQDFS